MECFLSLFWCSTPFFLFIYNLFKAVIQTLFFTGTLAFLSWLWLIVFFFFIIIFRRSITPATRTTISFFLSSPLSGNCFINLLYVASISLIEFMKLLQSNTSCQHIELIQCAERQFLTNPDQSSADFMMTIFIWQHAKIIFHPIIKTFCQVVSFNLLLQQQLYKNVDNCNADAHVLRSCIQQFSAYEEF